MKRARFVITVVLLAVALGGCNGPKGECEGTIRSYEAIIDGQKWDDFAELIWPPQRKKAGDVGLNKWLAEFYEGAQSFKFTAVNATVTKDTCLVQTMANWHQKIRGKNPQDFEDEYNTFELHLVDGKWYMEIPNSAKISVY